MGNGSFKVETSDGIARCTMSNPALMNALNADLAGAISDGVRTLIRDDAVRVIILRGEGGNFCSGADLTILGENHNPLALNDHMLRLNAAILDLHDGPKPVIAEVDGYAVGGGLSLALAADITYATERALFMMAWIRLGGVPDLGASYLAAERVGVARAKEWAYTSAPITADEALRAGLINKIVPSETISDEVMELARKLTRRPPSALTWTKKAFNNARHLDLQTVMDLEANVQPVLFLMDDHKIAVRKFFEKMMT